MKILRFRFPLLLMILSGALFAQEPAAPDPLKEKEAALRLELSQLRQSTEKADIKIEALSPADQEIFQIEEEERIFAGLDLIYKLSGNLLEQEASGNATADLREFVTARMRDIPAIILRALERNKEQLVRFDSEKASAEPSELGILEEQIGTVQASVDQLYAMAVVFLKEAEKLGLATADLYKTITDALQFRARLMAGRLKMQTTNRGILKSRISANPDDADLALKLAAVQVTIDNSVGSLEKTVRLMEGLKLDSTAYKAVLIQSTGDISKGFELSVIWQFIQSGWASLMDWFDDQMPAILTKLLIFLLTLSLFHLLGKLLQKAVSRALLSSRINISRLLGTMIAKTSYRVILVLGILVALMQIGISLTPLLAGIGVVGFIVGFALQDTLGNFASGMMILFYRPFDEGDLIQAADVRGKVHKMSLVSTTILTLDNQTLIVPNNKIWGNVICNLTDQDTRRVDLTFGVSYDSDIPHVERTIKEVLDSCDKILPNPEPIVKVHELGDSSVNFIVRPWVMTSDYWETHWYLTREMKLRFDQEGISIPFPQRDVHHYYPDKNLPSDS